MASRLVLALDVETTGLLPATDRIVELGWCLFDVDEKEVVAPLGADGARFISHFATCPSAAQHRRPR